LLISALSDEEREAKRLFWLFSSVLLPEETWVSPLIFRFS
jgi:hypothetical protein